VLEIILFEWKSTKRPENAETVLIAIAFGVSPLSKNECLYTGHTLYTTICVYSAPLLYIACIYVRHLNQSTRNPICPRSRRRSSPTIVFDYLICQTFALI